MKDKIEALKIAYQTELDGYDFYQKSAKKCKNRLGKVIFDSLAKEEHGHITMIKQIWDSLEKDEKWPELPKPEKDERVMPMEFDSIFKEAEKELDKNAAADADDIEAIKIAMDIESKGYDFYKKHEEEADNELEKEFYSRIAEQESNHYKILEETFEYLSNPSEWFSKKERPIFEGG
ncbi:MAG: hypothetical protein D6734_10500 [Candidatus Schekmanbacteria bacterium]|nr:MAG: hypothetical protein D6734_10500 [Candidatus Schekmanbacteria bacterium]